MYNYLIQLDTFQFIILVSITYIYTQKQIHTISLNKKCYTILAETLVKRLVMVGGPIIIMMSVYNHNIAFRGPARK